MVFGHAAVGSFLPPNELMVDSVPFSFEISTLPSLASKAALNFRSLSSSETLLSGQLKLLTVNSDEKQSMLPL